MLKLLINAIVFFIILFISTCLWFVSPFIQSIQAEIQSFLVLLTIICNLLVIVQLFISLYQFTKSQEDEKKKLVNIFVEQTKNLLLEFEVNRVVIIEILNTKKENGEENTIPGSRYLVDILKYCITRGIYHDLGISQELWNIYRLMIISNDLIEKSIDVMYSEHFSDPRDNILIGGRRERTYRNMNNVYNHLTTIQDIMNTVQVQLNAIVEKKI